VIELSVLASQRLDGQIESDWPDSIDRRPAIVGTIVRAVAHGAGNPAGFVAPFVAVKRDPASKRPGAGILS
jgi:hypothetical protein